MRFYFLYKLLEGVLTVQAAGPLIVSFEIAQRLILCLLM